MRGRQRKTSEAACFRKLLRSAQANDAKRTYALLIRWFAMTYPGVPLNKAVGASGDGPLNREVDCLAKTIYSSQVSMSVVWRGASLISALKSFRRSRIRRERSMHRGNLVDLNPDTFLGDKPSSRPDALRW
jgi:hypothetical protein